MVIGPAKAAVSARALRSLFAVAAVAAMAATTPAAAQRPATEIAALARPAVVAIEALDARGERIRSGTGFFVRTDGTLVTNYHVIEAAAALEIRLHNGEIYDRVFLVAAESRRDIAILRIGAQRTPALALAQSGNLPVGERIYVLGNPLGLEGTFSDGLVSSFRVAGGTELMQITAPISPGSSGGPVLDSRGEVVAIATLSFREGQNLNLAVPARYLAPMLQLAGEAIPFAAEHVPARFTESERARPARGSSGFVRPRDLTGTYSVIARGADETPLGNGELVVIPDDVYTAGGYVASGWYWPKGGSIRAIDSPVTLMADGRLAIWITTDLEGGFLREGLALLTPPGVDTADAALRVWVFSNPDRAGISDPQGVYRVEGRSRYERGRSDPLRWSGFLGIVATDAEDSLPRVRVPVE